jgi:curved DNA-binding protein CbpA
MGVGDCIPEEINPYKVLDIDNNASIPECKKAFRKLITSSNERKKKLGSLAYDILCNKDN